MDKRKHFTYPPPFGIKAICERPLTEKMVKSAGAWGVNHALNSLTFVVLRRKKKLSFGLHNARGHSQSTLTRRGIDRCQVVVQEMLIMQIFLNISVKECQKWAKFCQRSL